jgi:asparagine synthase (glutamine-hydrolysing)
VGAALSGGIDSSAVVMAMRAIQGESLDIHTFSYVADDPRIGEERWADMVGTAARATMHKVRLDPSELVDGLDALIAGQDQPFGSTSIFAQHRVYQLARERGIKVTLDGQGADEMLGGYPAFHAARFASLVRAGRPVEAVRFLSAAARTGNMPAAGILLRAGRHLLPEALQGPARRAVGQDLAPSWLNQDWFAARGVTPAAPSYGRTLGEELLDSFTDRSLPALLRYVDRNSMRHSVESRVPLLNPRLAEFVFALPEEHLIAPDGTTKAVFRQALRGLVPDAVLDRRDKIGFETPQGRWLETLRPWVEGVLTTAQAVPALNRAAIETNWAAAKAGRRGLDGTVWRWLNLIRWAQVTDAAFA